MEIDLTFIFRVLLGCAIVAGIAVGFGDVLPWLRRVMSRRAEQRRAAEQANVPVHVPVQPYQYEGAPAGSVSNDPTLISADTDASEGGTDWQPRLPRYPTEEELVIYLATVKDRRGKYLRSANDIAKFSPLHRNEVLRLVKEVREGVSEFRPLTPEQRALREELQLANGHE